LRGLLAVNAAVAAAGSMVFVNTVVIVQAGLGLTQSAVALALASFGAGSMVAALVLPRLLEKLADRRVMLGGIGLLVAGMFAGTLVVGHASLMALWFVLGLGYSTAQTPSGRLLRRSSNPEDRPALFAAQFALSHACWLLFYPLAGWLGARYGMPVTFAILGSAGALAVWVTSMVWPSQDPEVIEHEHTELPPGHPHGAGATSHGVRHSHPFVVDDNHPSWPRLGG
jgi:MFS family permease